MLGPLIDWGYLGLFIASFLSATFLPLSSELILVGLIVLGLDYWGCILIATMGNWLGGMTNYYIGKLGKIEWIEKYMKIEKEKILKIQNWINKKGAIMGFFGFLPVIGDAIILVLGFMRTNVYIMSISMLIGKFLRYFVLTYGFSYFMK